MIDKIAALIIRDKKLMLVREYGSKTFHLPGGKRKLGESDEACLRREIMEELHAGIREMNYFGKFDEMAFGAIKIIAYICKIDADAKPSNEIEEIAWDDSKSKLTIHQLTKEKIIAELVEEGIIN